MFCPPAFSNIIFCGSNFARGILGTIFGSLVTVLVGKRSEKLISHLLSCAGGVMTGVVFFDLIPEAIELSNLWIALLGLVLGAMLVFPLNGLVDRKLLKTRDKTGLLDRGGTLSVAGQRHKH